MPSWSWHKTSFLNVQEIDVNSFKSPIRLNRLDPLAWEWRPSDSCEPYYRLIFRAKWAKIVWFCGVGSWLLWYVGISWVQAPPTSDSPLTTAALSLSHSDAPWVYKKQTLQPKHWDKIHASTRLRHWLKFSFLRRATVHQSSPIHDALNL